MSRTCTICTHPDHEDIDRALVASEPFRRIAARFTLSEASVRRHKGDHLSQVIVAAAEANGRAHGVSLEGQLERLLSRTNKMLDQAEEAGDLRTFITGSKEVRATLELIGKLMGRFVSRHDVNVSHNITAGLSFEQLEDVARQGRQVREAHGIVDVEAYLVQDLRG